MVLIYVRKIYCANKVYLKELINKNILHIIYLILILLNFGLIKTWNWIYIFFKYILCTKNFFPKINK